MLLRFLAALPCTVLLAGLHVGSAAAQAPAPLAVTALTEQPAFLSDSKFKAAMDEGKRLKQQRQYSFAADSHKMANKIAGGKCAECLKEEYGRRNAPLKFDHATEGSVGALAHPRHAG